MLPEFGAVELLFIAAIALIVVGPKDLPVLMRKAGKFLAQMRGMAAEFRASFDELARQSELEDLRREVEAMREAARHPMTSIVGDTGFEETKAEIDSHLADRLTTPEGAVPPPAVSEPSPAEAEPAKAEETTIQPAPETRH
jgi:sec-independent protein translocase protein TatB